MKYILLLLSCSCLTACWQNWRSNYGDLPQGQKVWGSKPVYEATTSAKQIHYMAQKQPVLQAGNIYAFGKYIFQIDVGRGIHVIDNTDPTKAERIGFIVVNGCAQISIKGAYLYTNSISDLVTLDISDPAKLREVSRVPNAFPEFTYSYPLSQPEEPGYYACPRYDSVVVGWVKDSIYSTGCYKN